MALAIYVSVTFILILSPHFNTSTIDLYSYLDKTLQVCHSSAYQFYSSQSSPAKGYHGPHIKYVVLAHDRDWRSRYKRMHSDIIRTLVSYKDCVKRYWAQCLQPNSIVVSSNRDAYISHRPCYYGELSLTHDAFVNVTVNSIFQINLTFTHFYLNHHDLRVNLCEFHHMEVSFTYCNVNFALLDMLNTQKRKYFSQIVKARANICYFWLNQLN